MSDDFNINEVQVNFDFKGFLFKLLSYWPLFVISLAIAFGVAYYINVRKLPSYKMDTLITIKDDQNPFFTTNTSLTFNWGGTTDKVNTSVVTIRSRSHNEEVVDKLQYYVNYKRDGKYQLVDAYKQTPFFVEVDTAKRQLLGQQFKIVFKDSVNFVLSTVFENDANRTFQRYNETKEKKRDFVPAQTFQENYKIGQAIASPYFNGTLLPNRDVPVIPNKPYYILFSNFDSAVKAYSSIAVNPVGQGSSVLNLSMVGKNKARIVDYLNGSVQVLSENMLERKNLFATKTIRFIDSSLNIKSQELKDVEQELNEFKNKNAVFNLESEGAEIKNKLNALDIRKESVNQQLNYYSVLEDYLRTRTDYRDVPAPSVAGISENSIVSGVAQIVSLAQRRNTLEYSYKEGATPLLDLDRQIDAVKRVLLENITSSKGLKNQELRSINAEIGGLEAEMRTLPKEQQDLLKIERRYSLNEGVYNLFL
ncbi:MAG TPA: sugar transporter, partial [Flavobacteriaceae bacterium]|nr:sugar transporter [Flavobacteriaceae bacterium]